MMTAMAAVMPIKAYLMLVAPLLRLIRFLTCPADYRVALLRGAASATVPATTPAAAPTATPVETAAKAATEPAAEPKPDPNANGSAVAVIGVKRFGISGVGRIVGRLIIGSVILRIVLPCFRLMSSFLSG